MGTGLPVAVCYTKLLKNKNLQGTIIPLLNVLQKWLNFFKLYQTFLITAKRVVATSAVAWQLLLTFHVYHYSEEGLKDANELYKGSYQTTGK